VWKVTPAGVGTFFSLSGSLPISIVAGPDGNLWVSDFNGSLWSVSTSGSATQYSLGGITDLMGIAVGPEGNVWIADETYGVLDIPLLKVEGGRSSAAPTYTFAGSTSGNITETMPEQGLALKTVILAFNAMNDAGQTITFPVTFQTLPALTNSTSVATPVFGTSSVTIPATAGVTGTMVFTGM
jgi:hypothetical protein